MGALRNPRKEGAQRGSSEAAPAPRSHAMPGLQRSIGNQALLQLFRSQSRAGASAPAAQGTGGVHAQSSRPASASVSADLMVNSPGDSHEKDAERVAAQVAGVSGEQAGKGQTVADDMGRTLAPPIVHDVLNSSGQRLDAATRSFMEPRFGRDLSSVRIHTDRQAAESARAVNARAYTVGNSVVFGRGEYAPQSAEGRRLLAHELAHTMQQAPGAGAMLQRQPVTTAAASSMLPRQARLTQALDFLKTRASADVLSLINAANLSQTGFQVVKTMTIGSASHDFRVSLTWDDTKFGGVTMPAPNASPTIHDFTIELGWKPTKGAVPETTSSPGGRKYPYFELKSNEERVSYIIAELLYHEFTHLQLNIDRLIELLSPGFSGHSGTYLGYTAAMRDATGPATAKVRSDIEASLSNLALVAFKNGVKINTSRLSKDATDLIEFVINERFTFRKVGQGFGYIPREGLISAAYIEKFTGNLLDSFITEAIGNKSVKAADASTKRTDIYTSDDWMAETSALNVLVGKLYDITNVPQSRLLPSGDIEFPTGPRMGRRSSMDNF